LFVGVVKVDHSSAISNHSTNDRVHLEQTVAAAGITDLQYGHSLWDRATSAMSNQIGPQIIAWAIVKTDVETARPGIAEFLMHMATVPSSPSPLHNAM